MAKSREIPPHSVLATCIASIGKNAITTRRCCTNQQINALIPKTGQDSAFLYYALTFNVPQLLNLAAQTAVPIINKKTFGNFQVLLPPWSEQRKIAAVLSSVDDAIEKTQAVIDQVQVVKRGLMQELLTRGLPGRHTRFKQTEIGEIPEQWELRSVADTVKKLPIGRRYDKRSRQEHGPVPILDQSGDGFFGHHDDEPGVFASASVPVVTFANHTCAVRWHERPFSVIQNVFPLHGASGVRTRYLYHLLHEVIAPEGYRGHWPLLMGTLVPLPSEIEQESICAVIDSVEVRHREESVLVSRLNRLKEGLMSVLLTGELRVTPDTEAA